jgi:hypothetical protein
MPKHAVLATVVQDAAVTGGQSVLVWLIDLTGAGLEGPVAGRVYLDAKTGTVLASRPG